MAEDDKFLETEDEFEKKKEHTEDTDEIDATSEEIEDKMEEGELDEDVYSEEGRKKEMEDDEIETWEEGFMEGADGGGKGGKCRNCGKVLIEMSNVVEKEVKGEHMVFCSDKCVDEYEEKH